MIFSTRKWLAAGAAIVATTAVAYSETAPGDVAIEDGVVTESLTGQPGDVILFENWGGMIAPAPNISDRPHLTMSMMGLRTTPVG